jgi:hypothetical protein
MFVQESALAKPAGGYQMTGKSEWLQFGADGTLPLSPGLPQTEGCRRGCVSGPLRGGNPVSQMAREPKQQKTGGFGFWKLVEVFEIREHGLALGVVLGFGCPSRLALTNSKMMSTFRESVLFCQNRSSGRVLLCGSSGHSFMCLP